MASTQEPRSQGVSSLLDTDLYKLTMQSAVLKFFPDVEVTYSLTNRTPDKRLNREAFNWLEEQIDRLGDIKLSDEEIEYLRHTCPYLSGPYLRFLSTFQLRPRSHVQCKFNPVSSSGVDSELGDLEIHVKGLWVDTILCEIPLLALTSEAYFKFVDRDWNHDGQMANAKEKGLKLTENGCMVSEFGSRRRRDYQTHALVVQGLVEAQAEAEAKGYKGKITGTSNVHLAHRFGLPPIGTVAHEWFMGVAAVIDSYPAATETALRYWVATFGKGVLAIALTDTFGTPAFLRAFTSTAPTIVAPATGAATTLPSTGNVNGEACARDPTGTTAGSAEVENETYADIFVGTRQDSGDPLEFVKIMREFYDRAGTKGKKTIVFSDSLNVERCIEYREAAENAGFQPSFGVGTFFTNDFRHSSDGEKSQPMNIVIKLASANGKPAVKISDNMGKNTGDKATVARVKKQLGYTEKTWVDGDETTRWDSTAKV